MLSKYDQTGPIVSLHFGSSLFNKFFGFQPLIDRNTFRSIQTEKHIHLVGMAQKFWIREGQTQNNYQQ